MDVTYNDMIVYDFGKRKIWPKPELKTPFDALRWHAELVDGLCRIQERASALQREDHFVKNLDTLAFCLREALFKTMVLREAITGVSTSRVVEEQATK